MKLKRLNWLARGTFLVLIVVGMAARCGLFDQPFTGTYHSIRQPLAELASIGGTIQGLVLLMCLVVGFFASSPSRKLF